MAWSGAKPQPGDKMSISQADILANFVELNGLFNSTVGSSHIFSANRNGVAQSIPDNAMTVIEFNIEEYDVGSKFNIATYRFIPLSGVHVRLYAVAAFTAPASATLLEINIRKNGTSIARTFFKNSNNSDISLPVSKIISGNGTDYYDVAVLQVSGGAVALDTAVHKTYFEGGRVI